LPRAKFIVYRCSKCRRVQTSPLRYSSKRCPYCGHVNKLREVEALTYASTADEAAAVAAKIKELDGAKRCEDLVDLLS